MQSFGSNRTQPNSGPSRPTDEEIIKLAGALPDELQEVLFGPKSLGLGLDAYLRDADPKSGAPASAIRQVLDRFPSDRVPDLNTAMIPYGNDTLKARRDMWDKFAKLADAVQADLSDNILETVFQKLTELSPLAKNELEGQKGLCVHLQGVMESLRGLLFGETMSGRFPGVVTDRQGLLEIYVAGPLHDSLKYCQGVEFSSINPENNERRGQLRWVRSSCPHAEIAGEWSEFQYQKFSPEELLSTVEGYPRLPDVTTLPG